MARQEVCLETRVYVRGVCVCVCVRGVCVCVCVWELSLATVAGAMEMRELLELVVLSLWLQDDWWARWL